MLHRTHQAHEPDNDPTKRKTTRESFQLLNEIHEIDLEVPSKQLKSIPKETKKMPVQRKIGSEALEHSEQVELDPNEVLGICNLENTRRQKSQLGRNEAKRRSAHADVRRNL
jgi:hypothetical protein